MQRSSPSICLAAALAKAQAELANPEKSLVGTIKSGLGARGGRRAFFPLCPALKRARYRMQDAGPG
jgi:hypothetical protein